MHPLLGRQVKRHFGAAGAPNELREFLAAIDAAYTSADKDRETLERSLDRSSEELLEKSRRAEAKSLGILSAIPELVLFVGADDTVLDARTPWPNALLYPAVQCIGRKVSEIFAPSGALVSRLSDMLERARITGSAQLAELDDAFAGDTRRDLEVRVASVQEGEALVLVRDITPRKDVERALRESQTRFELAIAGSADGLWDWDVRTGRAFIAPNLGAMLGKPGGDFDDFRALLAGTVHPDDEALVFEGIAAHLEKRVPFAVSARLQHSNGNWLWFALRGQATWDVSGKPARMAGSIRDITDVKAKETELERARDAAQAASRAKDDFLANVSHEIRTPMNAILGLSHLLATSALRPRERVYADGMLDAGRTLLTLINDLLDVSRIESNDIVIAPIAFSLTSTVRELFKKHEQRATIKGLSTAFSFADDVPTQVFADPGRLRQILNNILDNAIKFTPKGSISLEISLGAASDPPATVLFRVRDSGIGIPASRLGDIMEKFTQLDSRSTRRAGGTGIGLTISNHLAKLMGGVITVESKEGSGSTFTLALPLPARTLNDAIRTPLAAPGALAGARALVVSDDSESRMRMIAELGSAAMAVDGAATLSEALDRMTSAVSAGRGYAVVVFHDRTSDLQSEAAAHAIRRDPRMHDTILGIVVTIGMAGDAARLFDAGFSFYLTAPSTPNDVRDAVAAAWQAERITRRRTLVTRHSLIDVRSTTPTPPLPAVPVTPPPTADVAHAPPVEPAPVHSAVKTRLSASLVLVVDDNEINRAVASELLERFGCRVIVADGGEEGARMALEERPALVLMDVQMPGVDGFQATRRIRDHETQTGAPRLPIVAVTANAMRGDRERCLDAGMDDYLSKPISRPRLQEVVERWISLGATAAAESVATPSPTEAPTAFPSVSPSVAPAAAPTAAAVAAQPNTVLDISQLRSIVGDDPARVRQFIDLFVRLTGPMLASLEAAIESGDPVAIKRQAHKLKGSCGSAGAREMAALAASAEKSAECEADVLRSTTAALSTAFAEVQQFVATMA